MDKASLESQLLVIANMFVISFVAIRNFLSGAIRYRLNNSAYKKRKKGETFKEWLFYSRYQEEVPRMLRRLYYFILFIHPISIVASVFLYLIEHPSNVDVGYLLASTIFWVDSVWIITIALLFWTPGRGLAYERWIFKKHGKKRK